MEYEHQKIAQKWQKIWEQKKVYQPDLKKANNPFYNLMMFPYPSAAGLHVGHAYTFSGADVFGRFKRMQGFNVFQPMGFDAFGIHSENYALKIDKHPKELTQKTIVNFKRQLIEMGLSLDWSAEIDTTSPGYYKWTQWIFLQLFKKGLVQRKKATVNWCPSCKTVLADEQVISVRCERCDSEVIKKQMEQWFFKITNYAEKLDKNLAKINWSEDVKKIQKNWIGRSKGVEVIFKIKTDQKLKSIKVFTTRLDTIFGVTFLALAPEHNLAQTIKENRREVKKYIEELQNQSESKKRKQGKTGINTGLRAINPVTGKEISIWVTDFVLADYGGGAVMGVPAHDVRDFEFAKKFKLPIKKVVEPIPLQYFVRNPKDIAAGASNELRIEGDCWEGEGVLMNSKQFNGMSSEKAREEIAEWLAKKELARKTIVYCLRDWLISRQRYWGPPIPIIHCDKCGIVPVPEKDLPVLLPEVENFKPTGTEKSPLAAIPEFINTQCPKCGGSAQRESDVSDNFLDSAWYFLRYPSVGFSNSGQVAFDREIIKKWLPVDMYIGGREHAVLHLMYTRFITMSLYDMGHLDFEEPFKKFRAHGVITKDGVKMAKSRGNVVNPDEYLKKFGADCFRIYLLFLGPFNQGGDFNDKGIAGIIRFLNRIWSLAIKSKAKREKLKITDKSSKSNKDLEKKEHQTIKKVTEDIENLRFNTAIAALMKYLNELERSEDCSPELARSLILLLAPFAPYITEELWQKFGNKESIHKQAWPKYNSELIKEEAITLIIQINGKVRDKIEVEANISEEKAKDLAISREKIRKWIKGKKIKKIIFIPGKLINIVQVN